MMLISEEPGIQDRAAQVVTNVADSTGLSRWLVILLISGETTTGLPQTLTYHSVFVLSTATLCSWCFWRFFKKKRPKDKKKDGKKQDDEDFLVDNEEEMDIKEELEVKHDSRKEYLGKFQYKVPS